MGVMLLARGEGGSGPALPFPCCPPALLASQPCCPYSPGQRLPSDSLGLLLHCINKCRKSIFHF